MLVPRIKGDLGRVAPRVVKGDGDVNRYLQHAFAIERFHVLCPYCSREQWVSRSPRIVNKRGDGIFKCFARSMTGVTYGCEQRFLYSPFVDKPREEILRERAEADRNEEIFRDLFDDAIFGDILQSMEEL